MKLKEHTVNWLTCSLMWKIQNGRQIALVSSISHIIDFCEQILISSNCFLQIYLQNYTNAANETQSELIGM